MTKTLLITGATDGIGLETVKRLSQAGHTLLLHGRSQAKLDAALAAAGPGATGYLADLSDLGEVARLAEAVTADHARLDVLINNAGVLKMPQPVSPDGEDLRFVVNTFAPVLLSHLLLPIMPKDGRLVHLSSAAQASVNVAVMEGGARIGDMDAYAQSKLALTMWSKHFADKHPDGPLSVAVNPGSLLASKMVKEGFGVAGSDIGIGADILIEAALSERFADKSGQYFDNDSRAFAPPHGDALDEARRAAVVAAIERRLGL